MANIEIQTQAFPINFYSPAAGAKFAEPSNAKAGGAADEKAGGVTRGKAHAKVKGGVAPMVDPSDGSAGKLGPSRLMDLIFAMLEKTAEAERKQASNASTMMLNNMRSALGLQEQGIKEQYDGDNAGAISGIASAGISLGLGILAGVGGGVTGGMSGAANGLNIGMNAGSFAQGAGTGIGSAVANPDIMIASGDKAGAEFESNLNAGIQSPGDAAAQAAISNVSAALDCNKGVMSSSLQAATDIARNM